MFWCFEIITWLGRKNLFQTFELRDNSEIEQEIKVIRAVLNEDTRQFLDKEVVEKNNDSLKSLFKSGE